MAVYHMITLINLLKSKSVSVNTSTVIASDTRVPSSHLWVTHTRMLSWQWVPLSDCVSWRLHYIVTGLIAQIFKGHVDQITTEKIQDICCCRMAIIWLGEPIKEFPKVSRCVELHGAKGPEKFSIELPESCPASLSRSGANRCFYIPFQCPSIIHIRNICMDCRVVNDWPSKEKDWDGIHH